MAEDTSARIIKHAHSAMPWLTVFTPCYKRPEALERNRAMMMAQTCQNFEQILVIDDVGRGFAWVARQLGECAWMAKGRYVMAFDDDDILNGPEALQQVYEAVSLLEYDPEVIVVQFGMIWTFGQNVVIPEPEFWHQPPVKGHISGQNVIVRRDVYLKHQWEVDESGYAYDIRFIRSVLDPANGYRVLWLPQVTAKMQYRGLGRTEEALAAEKQPVAAS